MALELTETKQASKKYTAKSLGFIIAPEKASDICPYQRNKKYGDDKTQHVTDDKSQCPHGIE